MCGRYEFSDEKEIEEIHKIVEEIQRSYGDESQYKTGEIFPTNDAPILIHENAGLKARIMKWGFPKWDGKGVIINARSETAADRKMFSKPLFEKRCIIPAIGFYEWQRKDKYFFTVRNSPVLYMAGIYNIFKDKGGERNCFTILTREANSYINDIHERMPVILYPNELLDWIQDDRFIEYVFRRQDIALERNPA